MKRPLPGWMRGYRLCSGLLILIAVVVQFATRAALPNFVPLNFFSFFTIQSNLIAAAVLLWGSGGNSVQHSQQRDLIRGAAVLYLSITGVVYGILLSDLQEQLQTTIPWVDAVLHKIIPLVMVFDWLADPPQTAIPWRSALLWLLYPLLYLVYTLARGPFVAWYPYPFLNPAQPGGYGAVALYAVAITIGATLFAWLVVQVGRRVQLVVRGA